MSGRNETVAFILPVAAGEGEGDHAKHGGGVFGEACSSYPSTTLRVVPLPTASPQGGLESR
jgi:hypothetical protein